MWLFDFLIFYNRLVDYFIEFFGKLSIFALFALTVSCRCRLLAFRGVFAVLSCILLVQRFEFVILLCSLVFFRVFVRFRCVCDESYYVIAFLIFAFGWFICVLILLFRLVTSFLFLVFTEFMYCLNRSSFLIPLCSSPAWSLHTTILFANMVCFLAQPYFVKHVPITHFGLFFLVFSSLPWLYTPLHSSLSIIILSHSLFTILHRNHKTSCPGKFPRP